MNADRLLALYDRVAEAPDAIARLRRFVLDLAVRGKLVEQDPADEPASDLLKRIARRRRGLVVQALRIAVEARFPFDLRGWVRSVSVRSADWFKHTRRRRKEVTRMATSILADTAMSHDNGLRPSRCCYI